MTEADLLPEAPGCPICGTTSVSRMLTIQTAPYIHWARCSGCRCGFATRQPTVAFLNAYYAGYYDGDTERVHIAPEVLATHILRRCRLPNRRIRILDFGGGDGSVACAVATRLRAKGLEQADITVVDHNCVPNPRTPDFCKVTLVRELPALEAGPKFDLVIASAVLEHVLDPGSALTTIWGSMAPGGWFYARTPYALPLASLLRRGGITFDLNYPAHMFDLGAEFWASAPQRIAPHSGVSLSHAGPSLVETRFRGAPVRTTVAYVIKAPHRVLGRHYPFVGGWEVFMHRPT